MSGSGRGRILVVDDDDGVRELIGSALSDEGYAVALAADGAEALREARREPPALIVLDVRMPVMDGHAFARAYRATPGPHAQIVVCTAALDGPEAARALGADGFLAKPFLLDELLGAVASRLRRP